MMKFYNWIFGVDEPKHTESPYKYYVVAKTNNEDDENHEDCDHVDGYEICRIEILPDSYPRETWKDLQDKIQSSHDNYSCKYKQSKVVSD